MNYGKNNLNKNNRLFLFDWNVFYEVLYNTLSFLLKENENKFLNYN
ncbi:hypothetical protein FGL01_21710 [Flavobacterium glycines]|uniref:Uncharacterized protein n=1 Tax=Flavobacterium glycines TaxID=551990 RepID=A0A511CFL4_9FLAO|nr:hypothetical protein FGL01_21710 [Flavobacterium glycines]